MGLLRQVTGQKSKWQREGTWRSAAESRVSKEAGTQTLGTNIDKRQTTVEEWVALGPVFEVCDR